MHIDEHTPYTECYYSRKVLKFSSLKKVFLHEQTFDQVLQDPENYVAEEDFERLDASSDHEFRQFQNKSQILNMVEKLKLLELKIELAESFEVIMSSDPNLSGDYERDLIEQNAELGFSGRTPF